MGGKIAAGVDERSYLEIKEPVPIWVGKKTTYGLGGTNVIVLEDRKIDLPERNIWRRSAT